MGQAKTFRDGLFQAFDQPGFLDVGSATELRTCDFDTSLDTPKDTIALKDLHDRCGGRQRSSCPVRPSPRSRTIARRSRRGEEGAKKFCQKNFERACYLFGESFGKE